MPDRLLSVPKLMFVVSTRAALGAGVALLASRRMSESARRMTGLTLALIGAITTIPAARLVIKGKPSLWQRAIMRA